MRLQDFLGNNVYIGCVVIYPYFNGLTSAKVIDIDTEQKMVQIAVEFAGQYQVDDENMITWVSADSKHFAVAAQK